MPDDTSPSPEFPAMADPQEGSAAGSAPKPRNGWLTALVAGSAVAAIGVGAGAFAIGSALSGGGPQPEDVLVAGAMAFAKLDLDPAANQKLAVYQLNKKFPDLFTDAGSDRALDSVVAGLLEDAPGGISYETAVKPWLGDRVGIAVYPPAKAGSAPRVAVAAQVADEAKMRRAVKKLSSGEDLDFVVRDGYVVLTDRDADDLAAAGPDDSLALQPDYAADVAALGGSQIAVAWADLGRIGDAVAEAAEAGMASMAAMGEPGPKDLGLPADFAEEIPPGVFAPELQEDLTAQRRKQMAAMQKQMAAMQKEMAAMQKQMAEQAAEMAAMSGRVAVGAHATGDYLEVQGRTFALKDVEGWSGAVAGTNLAGRMPADSLGAISGTLIADSAADQWKTFTALPMLGFGGMAEQYGLKLPADFVALFGTESAAALGSVTGAPGGRPEVTLRTHGGDMARAKAIATLLTDALQLPAPTAQKVADGFVLGNSKAAVQAAAAGEKTLAETAGFRRAVPEAADAALVVYADVAGILKAAGNPDATRFEGLDAVGFTVSAAENPTFRLRFTAD